MKTNDVHRTVITCEHSVAMIREALERELLDRTCGPHEWITRATAVCVTIMHRHADEIANEYKAILRRHEK